MYGILKKINRKPKLAGVTEMKRRLLSLPTNLAPPPRAGRRKKGVADFRPSEGPE